MAGRRGFTKAWSSIGRLRLNRGFERWSSLRGFAKLYGMITDEDAALFRQRLALKQVLRSRMGTHCIFELRERGCEILENCFVVHFDHKLQAVMVTSIYQAGETSQPNIGAPPMFGWRYRRLCRTSA